MAIHAEIDRRMKENYENTYRIYLTKRTPVIVRVDGRSFHTFTKGFNRPFDMVMLRSMQDTCKYLCENVSGCVLGYVQSDEISLLLIDYQTLDTKPFFDNNLQKICSITASMATLSFNRAFDKYSEALDFSKINEANNEKEKRLLSAYSKSKEKGACFDSRAFNIPEDEVVNYFYSRQLDASRNSIEMVGRAYFSDKELYKKNTDKIQDMLHEEHGINWNDFPTDQKRGACCIRETYWIEREIDGTDCSTPRSKWVIDLDIPQFKGEGRKYIENLLK